MGITLHNILKLSVLQSAQLLTDAGKLEKTVEHITILEGANTVGTYPRNVLIVTNDVFFMIYKSAGYANLMRLYRRRAVTGLMIKADRAKIPDELIAEADRCGIALIALPPSALIPTVINSISHELLRVSGYAPELSYSENFLQEMIFSENDAAALHHRAAMMGICADEKLGVLLLEFPPAVTEAEVSRLCREHWHIPGYYSVRNSRLLLAIRMNALQDGKTILLHQYQRPVERLHECYPDQAFFAGIGRCYADVTMLRTSYYEAKTALAMGRIATPPQPVTHYEDMGIYRILFDPRNNEALASFQRDTIGPLEKYDLFHQTDLLLTLKTYIEQRFSVQNTAKALYVHYNTVKHRIQKLESTFGLDLSNIDALVDCYIAIKISCLLEANQDRP